MIFFAQDVGTKQEAETLKLKKLLGKTHSVRIANESLDVAVTSKPNLVTVFEAREIPGQSRAMGPLGGLDLTGYSEYRLTLRFVGAMGTPFSIQELFGPAGAVDQLKFEIGSGQIGPDGVLSYRARFDIYGPRNFFIQISNDGDIPFLVDGSLYAVH